MKSRRFRFALGLGIFAAVAVPSHGASIRQSERELPVIADVDVVVVGGTSGGVAAAAAAAKAGARVFLAAPRHYLGTDICGTYRLWLEPGEPLETDLARAVFTDPENLTTAQGLAFAYDADQPSAPVHRDTTPPSLLNDGKWSSAPSQSVQYDRDVTLTLDLGRPTAVQKVTLLVYQRPGAFVVQDFAVQTQDANGEWQDAVQVTNPDQGTGHEDVALPLIAPLELKAARQLRLVIRKAEGAERILLGEVMVEGPPDPDDEDTLPVPPRPMHVKRILDRALLDAGVPFLYACQPMGILRDADGRLAGVVVANRSGRQAVKARVIIDATSRGAVARMAGATFTDYPAGPQEFERIVIGGRPRPGEGVVVAPYARRVIRRPGGVEQPVWEYRLTLPMPDGSFASFAEAEQRARDLTWTDRAVDGAESLFQVPPDAMQARTGQAGSWPGAAKVNLGAFQPRGVDRVYVLGGCAGVSREAAAGLLRPAAFMAVGERVGEAAAREAGGIGKLAGVRVPGDPAKAGESGDLWEVAPGVLPRFRSLPAVRCEARDWPVAAEYDVVVIGGGTGGAPAGIGAGRQGAKTLVVEFQTGLGGVGTMGLISSYYHGNRVGFTSEVDAGVDGMGAVKRDSGSGWIPEWKMEWYRQALRKAGIEVWFGAMGVGAVVDAGRVKGVLIGTPNGPQLVLAKTVVDATGNADIAAAAGAECRYMDGSHVAVQGTGLPPKKLGAGYTNTDYTFIDETDVFDVWRALVTAREKFAGAYDLGQFLDTRERRQIIGETTLTPMDMMLGRKQPDTVVIAKSNFDTHGFTVHPMFMIRPPDREDIYVNVPYRCLLPKAVDGVLVTGLGVSADRDAVPVIRMQADVQNQGYAAGVACAMAAREGKTPRQIDVKALQQHLVEKGNLPPSVLTDHDTLPLPEAEVARAVNSLINDWDGLEVVLSHLDTGLPLLQRAWQQAEAWNAKLAYAQVLGTLGDPTGTQTLVEAVAGKEPDKGWRFTGMGQFGESLSPLDSRIIALGRTHDSRALEPILEFAGKLTPESEFSHFRAVAEACEALDDPAAAPALAALLRKPGMTGYAVTHIDQGRTDPPPSGTDTSLRNHELTELVLARALYRCGDHEGLGQQILQSYANGLQGHYSRHASAVLAEKRR
ncbi:MAG: FAD-dependent oxidoreductase [Verrucomicrobiales bacterium]|nr:FAD-dependent oxidoreductase [Verrucomicrobiales bacterium]